MAEGEKKRGKGEAPKGAKRKILCVASALSAPLRERKYLRERKKQRLCARTNKTSLREKVKTSFASFAP